MKRTLVILCGSFCFAMLASPARAAQQNKDPLSDAQVEQVREAADRPPERIKLYLKYIEERTSEIHKAVEKPKLQHPDVDIHNLLQEFTRLADELQDNLSSYGDQHADERKGLRDVLEHSAKWPAVLNEPRASGSYDFARKTALEAALSTNDMAKKLLMEQEQYFAEHKPAKQTSPRSEPR